MLVLMLICVQRTSFLSSNVVINFLTPFILRLSGENAKCSCFNATSLRYSISTSSIAL